MKLYNSLTRKVEEFTSIKKRHVGMYTCGPTVYDYASIGNFRTYTMADVLLRALKFNGYDVTYVMNITDVGHLTGDNEGDADTGEDRLEKGAKREGKTAWDIAKFYTEEFLKDCEKLNLSKPQFLPKATEHITEQINLVSELEKKGLTYRTSDGIYFDTQIFEHKTGKKYGELSDLDEVLFGARVTKNSEKKNPRDFALWKFSGQKGERHMEWESPWGLGFPGWHIECSAMSTKYLGPTFDIHTGGEDLKQTHHPNEIAQSEGATDKPFVHYWMHVRFLKVDGKRMGKSLGNFYTVSDLETKGLNPIALRYLYLTAHYRDSLNFSFSALEAAQKTLDNLVSIVADLKTRHSDERVALSEDKLAKIDGYKSKFTDAINNDLNTPQALSVLWEVAKSSIPSTDKLDLILLFDEVLGLKMMEVKAPLISEIPAEIEAFAQKRFQLRSEGKYAEADKLRQEIEAKGFVVKDTSQATEVVKK